MHIDVLSYSFLSCFFDLTVLMYVYVCILFLTVILLTYIYCCDNELKVEPRRN